MITAANLDPSLEARIFEAPNQRTRVVLSPGTRASNVLRVAANVVEGETVTIGSDIYEVDIINTASGVNTSGGNLNTTAAASQVTHAAHGRVAGDLIRVENEIMKVLRVLDANTYVVARGRCGTTIATHADALGIFVSNGIPAAGRIPVGLVTTLTPAVFTPALVAEINNAQAGGERAVSKASTIFATFQATSLQAGAEMLLAAIDPGALATATTETLAGVNNGWSSATVVGGSSNDVRKISGAARVPTATEVALGTMQFIFNFVPAYVTVSVIVTATGVPTAWVGGIVIGAGGLVTVNNAGATDWAVTDTVRVTAYGEA